MKIAVDAMGGDHAPDAPVEGAILAHRELGIEVLLSGREDVLEACLRRFGWTGGAGIRTVHATEVVEMADAPSVVFRKKQNASVRVAARLVGSGEAQGFVGAGNTGAQMAAAMLEMGRLAGVDRPAIALVYPTAKGLAVILDVGANVDCKPEHLAQFAVMGSVYCHVVYGKERPRVGILNIGEEEGKGNELTKATFELLRKGSLNFVGNVEGKDLFHDRADVVVCDGFIGNVLLKVSENLAVTFGHFLEEEIRASLLARAGYLLQRRALRSFKKRADYTEFGGLPLLGVRGGCVICHGRSPAKAIKNAIRVAAEFSRNQVNEQIEALLRSGAGPETGSPSDRPARITGGATTPPPEA